MNEAIEDAPMSDEITRTERAVDELLRALREHGAKRPASDQIVATPFVVPDHIPTRSEIELAAVLSDPVGASLRQGVRRLGGHLFAVLGTTDAMREVLERVADLDTSHYGMRASVMDHVWDGIGAGSDRWWS